jgi:hypothetical protein
MNQDANTKYYKRFVRLADDGIVFAHDWSHVTQRELSAEEIEERQDWIANADLLHDHYYRRAENRINSVVHNPEMLLRQRLPPPRLGFTNVSQSASTAPRQRFFPVALSVWDGFACEVDNFVPIGNPNDPFVPGDFESLFAPCLHPRQATVDDEAGEYAWITGRLASTLVAANLAQLQRRAQGLIGDPDFTLRRVTDGRVTLMCEAKATHSLRLPVSSQTTVDLYDTRNRQVCNPLGQLLRHMIDNKIQHGALTSSTRTYFVCIDVIEQQPEFFVSTAWLVGEENYLRAWAYIHDLACMVLDSTVQIDWVRVKSAVRSNLAAPAPANTGGSHASKNRGRGSGSSAGNSNMSNAAAVASASCLVGAVYCVPPNDLGDILPMVSGDDLQIDGIIGYGRNGTVFKARWGEQEIALKQFDLSKGGGPRFQSEASAYSRLREAWGKLVPRPLFLSESVSGNVTFLGLQLGRPFADIDGKLLPRIDDLLEQIRQLYGIQLLDACNLNFIYLPSEDGTEALAAIDLEDHELVDFNPDGYYSRGKV